MFCQVGEREEKRGREEGRGGERERKREGEGMNVMHTYCSLGRCMGYGRGEYSTGQDCRASNPCASGFGTSSRCGVGDSCLPSRKICFSNSSTSVECKQYTCGMLNSTYYTIDLTKINFEFGVL